MLLIIFTLLLHIVHAAYDPNQKNLAIYWGNGANQERLKYYCDSGAADMIIISFVNNFSKDSASFNFGNACGGDSCPQIEEDIKYCQKLGIKVTLSLGGDDRKGKYGLKSDDEGTGLANVMYNMFHPKGTGKVKPFGDAEIDGFDFNIENGKDKGLAQMMIAIRKLWTTKTLIFSATPQCPYPDGNVWNLLLDKDAKLDIAYIQYYNNACAVKNGKKFKKNWAQWVDFVANKAGNPNLQLYIGLAGKSSYSKNSKTIAENTKEARKDSAFKGFFIWDFASAFANTDKTTGMNYAYGIRNILHSDIKLSTTTSTILSTTTIEHKKSTTVSVVTSVSDFSYFPATSAANTALTTTSTASKTTTSKDGVANKGVSYTSPVTTVSETTAPTTSTKFTSTLSKSTSHADDVANKGVIYLSTTTFAPETVAATATTLTLSKTTSSADGVANKAVKHTFTTSFASESTSTLTKSATDSADSS